MSNPEFTDTPVDFTEMSEEKTWALLANHFDETKFIEHQVSSYDNFIFTGISKIISDEGNIVTPGYSASFSEVYVSPPSIVDENRRIKLTTPQSCRVRNLTYDTVIKVNILEKIYDEHGNVVSEKYHVRIPLARVPVMVNSKICNLNSLTKEEKIKEMECEFDNGGYFIIKGNERAIVAQIRAIYNKPMVFKQKSTDKYALSCEIRSMSDETNHSVLIQLKITKDAKSVVFFLPYIKEPIPAGLLFKAYGLTDEEIYKIIVKDNHHDKKLVNLAKLIIRDSKFVNGVQINCSEDALRVIGRLSVHISKEENVVNYATQIIQTEIFPHLGIMSTEKSKILILSGMVNKLINTHLKYRLCDDRDDYSNRRVETTGILMTDLFRTLYKRWLKGVRTQLEKKKFAPDIISIISKSSGITTGLKYSFSTGNWGLQKNSYIRTGVSQVMSRLSFGAGLSHLRRLVIPIGKEGKNVEIRQVHPSQIMYICPVESPEGQAAGIVLNFSLLTRVTKSIHKNIVKSVVFKYVRDFIHLEDYDYINNKIITGDKSGEGAKECKEDDDEADDDMITPVLLNGEIIGFTNNCGSFIKQIREYRACDILDKEISVSYNNVDNEINIYCDEGRLIRPVWTLKDNKPVKGYNESTDWDTLCEMNAITYLDNSEVNDMVIAMDPRDTAKFECDYMEISPVMMLGVMGAMVPFSDHSQAPRNAYQSSMGKQAISVYALSHNVRSDTSANVLVMPQRPLVSTIPSKLMGFDEMASGVNAIVAIACYTGYNQEDSILINKSALERGLFTIYTYKTISLSEKKRGSSANSERICLPAPETRRKNYKYHLLGDDGIVKIGSKVTKNCAVIGKVYKRVKSGKEEFFDCSVAAKSSDEGIVDRIFRTKTIEGYTLIKVVIRKERIPEVGDKFAARSAQKGTVGMIFSQEDMPFTADGITPDIIINPHAIPSRMTINQMMECLIGKNCAETGKFGDATPFRRDNEDIITRVGDSLVEHGFARDGTEVMYSGFTGEPLKARIFIGPTYYQRLKHMVGNKIHSRNEGFVTTLTRQPVEGRARDGGLRFGEMERDCIAAHGASRFLKERLFDQSDAYTVNICDNCGNFGTTKDFCKICDCDRISVANMPYAAKLLIQELNAMSVKTIFETKI